MCKDEWTRAVARIGLVLLVLLGGLAPALADDGAPVLSAEEAAAKKAVDDRAAAERAATLAKEKEAAELVRSYARERLLQKARDTVDPSRKSTGGLEATRETLIEKAPIYSTLEPDEWAILEDLLGPLTSEGKSTDGLVRQAAMFFRWMEGGKESQEVPALTFRDPTGRGIEIVDEDGNVARERPTRLPVDSELVTNDVLADWALVQERDPEWNGQVVVAGIERLRAVEPPLAEIALTRPDELQLRYSRHYVDTRQRKVGPRVSRLKSDVPSAGLVSAAAVRTREARAQAMRDKVGRVLAMREGVQRSLDRLVGIEKRLTRESGGLGFEIEEARNAYSQVMLKQAEEEARLKVEEEARLKAEAEAKAKAAGEEAPPERAPDDAPLPTDEDPEDGADKPAESDESDPLAELHPAEKKLEELRLREILDAQRLRLLYIAVRRAELRLKLLDGVLNQVKEEAVAAEDAHERFVIALATIRRERQMDRLVFESTELELAHSQAHRKAEEKPAEESEPDAEQPVWAAYDRALEALIEVNQATIAGVKMRRDLETRTQPVDDASLEGCLPGDEPEAETETTIDALARFRTCRAASLDPIYVKDALTVLSHPQWDSRMTASHYEAVDDRIADLESALAVQGNAQVLEERFQKAISVAHSALGEVEKLSSEAPNWWDWRVTLREARAEWLLPNEKAFQETMRGINDGLVEVQDNIGTYRTFRSKLLNLGTRSFRVRIQRSLDTERLGVAYEDSVASLKDVGQWVSGSGDDNLFQYVQRNWKLLLGCLGVLLGSFALVRYGRKGLDVLLRKMASRVSALQAGDVSLGTEHQLARLEKERAERAARDEEEAALREVSKGEADKAQRMGEGGYSEEAV